MAEAKIIGICGGSGSGKTTIVRKISELVSDFVFVPQDNYYKSAEYISNANITAFNFDHPEAFDNELLWEQLSALKRLEGIEMPTYDFVHHRRAGETIRVSPRKLVIFEGIMVFTNPAVRDLIDLKIFVDTPDDIRFIRRLTRDIKERGRTVDSVIEQYMNVVRPGHFQFIEPTKHYADIIIPEGGANESALQVLVTFIKTILDAPGHATGNPATRNAGAAAGPAGATSGLATAAAGAAGAAARPAGAAAGPAGAGTAAARGLNAVEPCGNAVEPTGYVGPAGAGI